MASAITNQKATEGVVRFAKFTIAADAAASAATATLGFTPLWVRVVNTTDSSVDELFEGASAKINTAGAGAACSALTMSTTALTVTVTMANNKAATVHVFG